MLSMVRARSAAKSSPATLEAMWITASMVRVGTDRCRARSVRNTVEADRERLQRLFPAPSCGSRHSGGGTPRRDPQGLRDHAGTVAGGETLGGRPLPGSGLL